MLFVGFLLIIGDQGSLQALPLRQQLRRGSPPEFAVNPSHDGSDTYVPFVVLFIVGNVFNLIPHNAAVSRRLLAAASAFSFANAILSVALLYARRCGQTPDKVVSLKNGIFGDLPHNGNDIPLTASLNVAPFYSLAAAILLGLSALWPHNIEARAAQMTSASQSKLIYGELVACGVAVLLCVTPCH